MDATRIQELLQKQFENQLTTAEQQELNNSLADPANEGLVKEVVAGVYRSNEAEYRMNEASAADMLAMILSAGKKQAPVQQIPVRRYTATWMAAAAVLLIAVAGWWYLSENKRNNQQQATTANMPLIPPGKTGALLKLSDGRIINLDSINGQIADGIEKNGELVSVSPSSIAYATLEAPRGRTITTKLSDDTTVWLNAGSSIRFPTKFNGKSRDVEMTGEAYFEVAHNAKQPFHVKTRNQDITVLGTQFNVNAYDDEDAVRTTLVQGSVKISNIQHPTSNIILAPDQQAITSANEITLNRNTDIDQTLAWKNGFFSFDDADLQQVMRQIARWYDVEVVYEGKVPKMEFGGRISRQTTANEVLKILEKSQVRFRVEGNKRIVILN